MIHPLGVDSNLIVTVRAYTPPSIVCQDLPLTQRPFTQACATILSTMPLDENERVFGDANLPGVQVGLPVVLTERKKSSLPFVIRTLWLITFTATGRCTIIVSSHPGQRDRVSWHDLWEAAVAMDGMCVRGSMRGALAPFLGKMLQTLSYSTLRP